MDITKPLIDAGSRCIPSTEELINACRNDFDAYERLPPHHHVRVQFATALKQIAYAAKLDPGAGMEMYWMIEKELERAVEAAFRPALDRAHREGVRDGLRMAEFDRKR